MQWFKHDSDASSDAKIKKLINKHGAIGYAVYFHCLELITRGIDKNNITFELEHDSEIIADNLKISGTAEKSGSDIVSEIMRYCVVLDLFEESNQTIFCYKLARRLEQSQTANVEMRKMITKCREESFRHERLDKIRLEEKRIDIMADIIESTEKPDLPSINNSSIPKDKDYGKPRLRPKPKSENKYSPDQNALADSLKDWFKHQFEKRDKTGSGLYFDKKQIGCIYQLCNMARWDKEILSKKLDIYRAILDNPMRGYESTLMAVPSDLVYNWNKLSK